MNWPQSSYSSSNSSSMFGGGNQGQQPGYGTPGGQQHQQQPQQGLYGQQQGGYGTPGGGGSNLFSSPAGGFQSTAPTGLQQQTFSTSSPHQGQQQHPQQHNQQQQMMQQSHSNHMQGMGYQSQFGNGSSFGGSASTGQAGGQMMMSGGGGSGNAYGQYQQQQPQQVGAYGSPQAGNSAMQGSSGAPSTGVGRYLPGYLTASSLSGSPRQSTSSSLANHDGRLSPEQSHRDTGSSFGAGSSRLFASSTSSAGTAGRESPSRSPKQSLFSSSAYGSSRSLALTPATGSRPRRTSSNNLVRPGHDEYMEEDAPPIDTLDDFDNDAGVPYVASPPPSSQPALINASSSPAKRQIGLPNGSAGPSSSSSAFGQITQNGQSSNNNNSNSGGVGGNYKLIVYGYPPNLQASVVKEFASIAPVVYNSIQDPSPSSSATANGASDVPPTGFNWFTIAYDSDWAALRALRKNGSVIADTAMIGVRWADPAKNLDLGMDLIPSSQSQTQQQPSGGIPRSSTASNLGTPATVLPASQAFLPNTKQNTNNGGGGASSAMRKSATLNRINEMGKIDPSIFKQPEPQQKQGGGVVGTLTNLIFGF